MPKLILLEGFAGSGKTTIAKRYIDEHPLAMNLEGDELITMVGQWLQHEDEARVLVFALSKAMVTTCLESGKDIVVPYLPTHPDHARDFEHIAHKVGATFCEIILAVDRHDAIERLLQRGSWGEAGTEPLTNADMPVIDDLHDRMTTALEHRHNAARITSTYGDPEDTYRQFLAVVDAVN
jgi:predicted kinase